MIFLKLDGILLNDLFICFIHSVANGNIIWYGFVQLDEKLLCLLVLSKLH